MHVIFGILHQGWRLPIIVRRRPRWCAAVMDDKAVLDDPMDDTKDKDGATQAPRKHQYPVDGTNAQMHKLPWIVTYPEQHMPYGFSLFPPLLPFPPVGSLPAPTDTLLLRPLPPSPHTCPPPSHLLAAPLPPLKRCCPGLPPGWSTASPHHPCPQHLGTARQARHIRSWNTV